MPPVLKPGIPEVYLNAWELRDSEGEYPRVLFDLNLYFPIDPPERVLHWQIKNFMGFRDKNGRIILRGPTTNFHGKRKNSGYKVSYKSVFIDSLTYDLVVKKVEAQVGHKLTKWERKVKPRRKNYETAEEAISAFESTTYGDERVK